MSRYLKQFFLSVALIFSLSSLVTIFVSAEPFDGNCIYRETLAEATDTKISRENCPICHLPEAQRFSHFNSCQLVNGTNTHQPARKYQRFNRPIQRDSSMDTQKKGQQTENKPTDCPLQDTNSEPNSRPQMSESNTCQNRQKNCRYDGTRPRQQHGKQQWRR
ncbi:hypothetical protein CBF34_00635 [Vagococcus penaei]|uniref:hypothetical protein n=1 Tax=Vagococcus penaei TaxID=633807 RepID=UPI000F85D30B|nr:hypothetical protein [Vagococcus penaei]RSU07546.1 hypothetical protein CBF34_00635 [Vagococcus penaei]